MFKASFSGQPLDMLQGLATNRILSGGGFVETLRMNEYHHGVPDLLLSVLFLNVGQALGMGLPPKSFGLKAEKSHGAKRN